MSEVFKSIEQGLQEALAYARGEGEARVHKIELQGTDVQAIRARTGMSQAEFAMIIGVKKATLASWELRRRNPGGSARVLLALIDKDPRIAQRTLATLSPARIPST